MSALLVVIVAGIGAYLLRVSMLGAVGGRRATAAIERAGRFAVPTAFAALIVGALTAPGYDRAAIAPAVAVAAAVVAVRCTGRPHAALLAGMPVLWLASAAVGR